MVYDHFVFREIDSCWELLLTQAFLSFIERLFIKAFLPHRHGSEMHKLMNEMESQKELLLTYEQTLTHKDSIVTNITHAIHKQVCCTFLSVTYLSSRVANGIIKLNGMKWMIKRDNLLCLYNESHLLRNQTIAACPCVFISFSKQIYSFGDKLMKK